MQRLDAINLMFAAVSETPVPDLASANQIDQGRADRMLTDSTRLMLAMGWTFNTYRSARLQPQGSPNAPRLALVDGDDGWTPTLQLWSLDPAVPLVQVGNRVVNKDTGSAIFADDVKVRAVVARNWDELPEAAQQYAAQLAKARYANDTITSATQANLLDPGVKMALQLLARDFSVEPITYDANMIPDWRLSQAPGRRAVTSRCAKSGT